MPGRGRFFILNDDELAALKKAKGGDHEEGPASSAWKGGPGQPRRARGAPLETARWRRSDDPPLPDSLRTADGTTGYQNGQPTRPHHAPALERDRSFARAMSSNPKVATMETTHGS